MKDDLKNERKPQKWKMTSKMEDDLKNKITSNLENNLKNGKQPQKLKATSEMEDYLKNVIRPQKCKTTSKL